MPIAEETKRDKAGRFAREQGEYSFKIRKDPVYGVSHKDENWMERNAHKLKLGALTTAAAYGAYHAVAQNAHFMQAVSDHLSRIFSGQDWAILGVHGHPEGGHAGYGK